jgi:hypothetical protein
MPDLVHATLVVAGLLFQATVTVTALVAVLSRTPRRRQAARAVLRILLHRPPATVEEEK